MTLVQNGDSFGACGSRLVHALDVGDEYLKLMFTVLANVARCNVRAVSIESVVHAVVGQILRVAESIANTFFMEKITLCLNKIWWFSHSLCTFLAWRTCRPSSPGHPSRSTQRNRCFCPLGSCCWRLRNWAHTCACSSRGAPHQEGSQSLKLFTK